MTSEEQQQGMRELADHYDIHLVVAFGSQVRGSAHPASDLDLAVLQRQPAESDDPLRLIGDLQRLFPGQEVDVVWLHRADPLLAWEILQGAQLLYGDRRDLLRYQTYAWRRFVEYGRFFALEAAAVREGIARLRHAHR